LFFGYCFLRETALVVALSFTFLKLCPADYRLL
jgi:hypothetical protein